MNQRPRRTIAAPIYNEDLYGWAYGDSDEEKDLFPSSYDDRSPPSPPPELNDPMEELSSDEEEIDEIPSIPSIPIDNGGWSQQFTSLNCNLFTGTQGIRGRNNQFDSPLTAFRLFFSDLVHERIARETNKYAESKGNESWINTNQAEVKKLIACLIYMGVDSIGDTSLYWASPFNIPFITRLFTRDRFTCLLSHIHLTSNNNSSNDKLYKVRWLLDYITQRCLYLYYPSENLAVDEAMIPFKGRLGFKQYIPSKPTKWGIKVWALADSSNGFLCNFCVYTGASSEQKENGMNNIESIVLNLCRPFEGKYHRLWMDNYFTSFPLLKKLKERAIYASGTVRWNRQGFPSSLKDIWNKKQLARLRATEKGKFHAREKDGVVATIWFDNGIVSFLSNCIPAIPFVKIPRRQPNGEQKEIDCPPIVLSYNKSMGAVDMHDQRREVYRIGRKSTRWWMPLFYYLLDVCIVNSFLLYKLKYPEKNISHRDFRVLLMQEMIEEKAPRTSKRTRVDIGVSDDSGNFIFNCSLVNTYKMRHCSVCSGRTQKDKKEVGKRVRTQFKCLKCNIYVCPSTCFPLHSI